MALQSPIIELVELALPALLNVETKLLKAIDIRKTVLNHPTDHRQFQAKLEQTVDHAISLTRGIVKQADELGFRANGADRSALVQLRLAACKLALLLDRQRVRISAADASRRTSKDSVLDPVTLHNDQSIDDRLEELMADLAPWNQLP